MRTTTDHSDSGRGRGDSEAWRHEDAAVILPVSVYIEALGGGGYQLGNPTDYAARGGNISIRIKLDFFPQLTS